MPTMGLLADIQNHAAGTEVPVTTVLRECLILAAKLNFDPMKQ